MLAELDIGILVGERLETVGRLSTRGLDLGHAARAHERLLCGSCPHRCAADIRQANARLRDGAGVHTDSSPDTDDAPGLRGAIELLVVRSPSVVLREGGADEELVLTDGRLERSDKELRCRNRATTSGAGDGELRVQGQRHRRLVCPRVRVGEGAADGAAMTDLRVRDRRCRLSEQRHGRGHRRIVHHGVVGGSRADDDPVTGAVDALDLVDAGAIDNELGCVQAQTQNGEERLPSAEHLCVVAAGECGDRIIDGGRPRVAESCRNHAWPPFAA